MVETACWWQFGVRTKKVLSIWPRQICRLLKLHFGIIFQQKQGGDSGDQLMEVDSCYYSSGLLSFPSTEPNDSVPMSIYGSSSQDKDSLLCGLLDIDDKES